MAKKLWQKNYELDARIEEFTVGDDYLLDRKLVRADCVGSVAHAKMLAEIGVLSAKEFEALKAELLRILDLHAEGRFTVEASDEDVHTRIENHLTEKLGDLGKKIHTGRSRNDQVIVDVRLYGKERLLELAGALVSLCRALLAFARKHEFVPMPGRTHTQIAMPSSVGLWGGSFLESLLDDLDFLGAAYALLDQCPLGSAASYGVALPIDRKLVADLLGFARVQNNVLYVNNSRGKMELAVLSACSQVMLDLSKMAQDLITYSMPEFAYFSVPAELCTGSSIMPQKKNPCGLELIRAKAARVFGRANELAILLKALPTGYNRDFQESKEPFMDGLETTIACVGVAQLSIEKLMVNPEKLLAGFSPEIFATDEANRLVREGVPFRDAYRQVATNLAKLGACDPVANIRSKTHEGATGNLGLEKDERRIAEARRAWSDRAASFQKAVEALLGRPYPLAGVKLS
ncbi:MAG: argininosuccinate lyase [Planctomycetota bacterium]